MTKAPSKNALLKARRMSEPELRYCLQYDQGNSLRIAADTELERRRRWHNFLTHGVIGWLSLAVAIGALVVAIIALNK